MDSSDRQQEEGNLIFDPKEIPQDPSLEYLGTKLFEAEYKQRVIRHLEASKSSKFHLKRKLNFLKNS